MTTDLPAQLLRDWSYFRLQTRVFHDLMAKGARIKTEKAMTPEIRAELEGMVEWCLSRSLEPRTWLYGLFRARGWIAAPRLSRGHLCSERLIPKYRRMKGLGFFARTRRAQARAAARDREFDPNRDLDPGVERLKARLVALDPRSCRDQAIERTLGYHPRSVVCRLCPERGPCAIKIQSYVRFDVLGLRLGQITAQQAQAVQERVV